MNVVHLVGRLTDDPQLRRTNSGKAVASFSVATNEWSGGQMTSEYHNCEAWERTAEFVTTHVKKGRLVEVTGRLKTDKWQDKDGNPRKTTKIVADKVNFAEGQRSGGGDGRRQAVQQEVFTNEQDYDPELGF